MQFIACASCIESTAIMHIHSRLSGMLVNLKGPIEHLCPPHLHFHVLLTFLRSHPVSPWLGIIICLPNYTAFRKNYSNTYFKGICFPLFMVLEISLGKQDHDTRGTMQGHLLIARHGSEIFCRSPKGLEFKQHWVLHVLSFFCSSFFLPPSFFLPVTSFLPILSYFLCT